MKKKLLITLIAIATITLSATAVYADGIGWTKNIYNVSDPEVRSGFANGQHQTVSKFKDGDTTCYVLSRSAISCVRTK